LIDELTHAAPPLLRSSLTHRKDRSIREGMLSMTEAGQAVLDGRADRIALCGVDRWIGGVHLQAGDRLWRWDRQAAQLVPPP
jgi:hypothetical protein